MKSEIKPDLPLKDGVRGRTESGRWYTMKDIGRVISSSPRKNSAIFTRVYDDEVDNK